MTYQVLARKWRPQDFSSLVGQEPIVTALRNALAEGRIAQAYLFSGIRGVGKTTAARVLAKALNCRGPEDEPREKPAADPCNACAPCREITSGADMDVIEVDAATYSKVEQVRELTESLRYGPARDRYKVVVLDEVHRLSRQAFDALLKIVEEPPAHLVFVFATTEIDAVPATILSRCQEFQFRRVASPVLAGHLRRIAEAESITVSENALRLLARAGEGSVRDAVALLDQLATYGNGTIHDEDASRLLGGFDAALFHRLLAAILAGQPVEIRAVLGEIELSGWDPHHVYSQFLGYARDALHLALGGAPDAVDLPLEEAEALAALARPAGYEALLRLSQLLLEGEQTVRRSEFAFLAVEIAWLRAAELPKVTRLEDLLSGRAAVTVPAAATAPAGVTAPAAAPAKTAPAKTAAPAKSAAQVKPPAPAAVREAPASPEDALERFRELLRTRKQPLAAHFGAGARLAFADATLEITTAPGDTLLAQALARPANAEVLAEVLAEVWGAGTSYRLLAAADDEPPQLSEPSTEERGESQDPVREHPTVQAVLDIFGGDIERVEQRRDVQQGAPDR